MTQFEFDYSLTRMESALQSFAMRLVKDKDDACDLVQETFLKALQNKNRFVTSSNQNLKSWLFTILKNTFINDYRRDQRQPKNESVRDLLEVAHIHEEIYNPESVIATSELNEAIKKLNNKLRVPLELNLSGYKYREISDMLNLNIGTVKSRIFLSKKTLQHYLQYKN